jgi:hypothetical protein
MAFEASRRSFFKGLGASIICAPAIVRATSLMPIKAVAPLPRYTDYDRLGLSPGMIRDLLLPGLNDIQGSYESVPSQWQAMFGV